MRSMTLQEFESRLMRISRCQFVAVTAVTDPRLKKRGNLLAGHVAKVTHASGAINWRYARVVNKQRSREGKRENFQAMPRAWGSRIKGCPLVNHVNADGVTVLYLELKVQRRHERFIHTTELVEIPRERIEKYLPAQRAGRQGLKQNVELRDYRLDHIGELRLAGEVWTVRPMYARLHSYLEALSAAECADNHTQPVEAAS